MEGYATVIQVYKQIDQQYAPVSLLARCLVALPVAVGLLRQPVKLEICLGALQGSIMKT